MFLVPPVTSIVLFLLLWWAGLLGRPLRIGICVLAGVAVQFLAPAFSLMWVLALLLNVGTAVYLSIRLKLDW
jgi:hypothetical protein